jgi:indole-3-glycerol phosphate synthase
VADILEKIIADKRQEVARRKEQAGLEELLERVGRMGRCRNFCKEITKRNRRGINVIAEVKKASPSAGLIREDFDPAGVARTYEQCGADAVSVLTDEKYFQGSLDDLRAVKEAVSLPVLRKDFIVDRWQIYEARAAGADAILLIGDALKPGELMDMMITATELTLSVLLEVHAADTLLKIRSLIGFPKKGYSVLGINNRNLATMEVDINTTGRLIGLLEEKKPFVTESGIKSRDDVKKVISMGASAVLIGESLCGADDIEAKFGELFKG